ncbi:hypothetical protein [Nocardia sp. NPDC020380]|uniref:hypothetical protein n=1 Tax=Nocardia sp. NPDC020380 TaxID=3364309 RepID=UPI0037B9F240
MTPKDQESGVRVAPPEGTNVQTFVQDDGTPPIMLRSSAGSGWLGSLLGNPASSDAKPLVDEYHRYNPNEGNLGELIQASAQKLGRDAGTALVPILGDQAPEAVAGMAEALSGPIGQAYANADPNGDWTGTVGPLISQLTGIPWHPTGQLKPAPQMGIDQQIGLNAVTSGISGLQQHGLLGGVTGAISGAASTAGGIVGGMAGTLAAPFLGPLGAAAPAIGSFIGSMVASSASEMITRPIELAGKAIKEDVGSGFGLLDLANGPGGHTSRGDIFNFNGMDPKSASIAVERVRRRQALAQQRGGGFGR